jgi:uncharacterized protein YjbI with pentapeptide repeats
MTQNNAHPQIEALMSHRPAQSLSFKAKRNFLEGVRMQNAMQKLDVKSPNLKGVHSSASLRGLDLSMLSFHKYNDDKRTTRLNGAYDDKTKFPEIYTEHVSCLKSVQKPFDPKIFGMQHYIERDHLHTPLRKLIPEEGISLEGLDLSYSNARGADLSKCEITHETNLKGAFYDETTIFPKTCKNSNYLFWPDYLGMITYEEKERQEQKYIDERRQEIPLVPEIAPDDFESQEFVSAKISGGPTGRFIPDPDAPSPYILYHENIHHYTGDESSISDAELKIRQTKK